MSELRYTDDHEWALAEGDTITVGITDYAQEQLGELVYVELPAVGTLVQQGDDAAVIESVKAAGDVKSPVSGTITQVNENLNDAPEKVNEDPLGTGWFYKVSISNPQELDNLLSEDDYNKLIASLD
ncbi:MAG TPA: glycine cleavage system protein GcvH [Arenicellales bacterium]|jgi:glycine cleavage system H protein|uniref:Lipoyl-binding domain-containing protein n=1 Tax=marine metagenome TaxID=408172 RepID=A0A381XST7_9ZZZZ|nr:glycine cleavage system protein GcvH [Arenicellales bacterium]MDP7218128.1 glycine cleavage system protein GcvH [Arenicellales bacterium]HCF74496.1 glycine cleavage system protein GcvH [Gammaproteobacteria bacterium]HJP09676.1 glycine cleavage system protein GcvH [Arenicellales bacterium]|tara:strand:- start:1613 stop:1990 length:378 start_codon:yes stop_codon:yes gene_type:complete